MAADWHVVVGADGTVLAVSGGAPAEWLGVHAEQHDALPGGLGDAARAVLRELHTSAAPSATRTVRLEALARTVELVAVEAVPIRRIARDPRVFLSSTLEVMRQQAKAIDVSLDVTLQPGLPPVMFVDPEKIAWAVTALVGNALRHVRRGTRAHPGGSIAVDATYAPAERTVTFQIRDDGFGIPAGTLATLFHRGVQPHAAGLGLLMVQDVAKAHGGGLEVQSSTNAADHGTTARLTLPAV